MGKNLVKLLDADLRQIAAALRSNRLTSPYSTLGMARLLSSAAAKEVSEELQYLANQGFTEDQIATALELVATDRKQTLPIADSIDLVTSGPEAPGTANRDTGVVVRELFINAEESVLVAGYAVYQGQRVFQALADKMQENPDLKVRLFLDIHRRHTDTSAASELVRRFRDRLRNQQWPKDRPLPAVYYDPRSLELTSEKKAALHAKCVVVDKKTVFVSSANFTEAAHERNLEIGLLIHSVSLAEQLVQHFDSLVDTRLLCLL